MTEMLLMRLVLYKAVLVLFYEVVVHDSVWIFNSSCTFLQVELKLLLCNRAPTDFSPLGICLCMCVCSVLGFPRRPASAVTTYSHLAAALLFWERSQRRMADFPLISFHLFYKPRLNNTTHFQCSLKRVLTLSTVRFSYWVLGLHTRPEHQQRSIGEQGCHCVFKQ